MAKVSREEVLQIAEMSKLKVEEWELAEVMSHLQLVLSYVEMVKEVSDSNGEVRPRNVNVFREDMPHQTSDSAELLKEAPQSEDGYFVVPKILDT